MKNRSALIESCMVLVLCLLALPALCGPVSGGGYYTEPQVYAMRPDPAKEMALDCIGATGIRARFYPGVILKVEGFTEKSPAEGKLKVGEIIAGVNGVALKGINPFVALGQALTAAEATDGRMVFDVKAGEDAEARQVTVLIPVLGNYSDTWPLNCEKSRKIIKAAAEYYAYDTGFREKYFKDTGENGGMPSALACLFLLSTGDDTYLPVVKAYFASFPKDVSKIGDHTWNNGYNGIVCAEYYLRTGDQDVLPILQYYCDNAKARQMFGCGWNHWGREQNPGYVAGGLMNPAGLQVLTTLLLGNACGVNVDEQTLLGALKFFYRFAGHGTVPYGDHRGEGGLGSNGKDGMAAAAMRAAMHAEGNTERYEMAMQHLSMSTLTSYPLMTTGHGDEGRGDGIWRGTASSYMLDGKPDDYHAVMNNLRWFYDLSRRPSGAIGMAGCQRFDDVGSGAGVAMVYTAPLKTLAITGAPRSRYAKAFTLPEAIWGNEADLAFLSIENAETFSKFGKEDPIEVPLHKFGNAYSDRSAGDLAGVPREEILKNIYHKNYLIRTQAAKALRSIGAFDELEKLLDDSDPRVRRAALDGICDYRYWFHLGKDPMKPEQFTPGMVDAIVNILRNKKEALWVTDGALTVLSCMSPETVGGNLDLVMPWTSHEEWWLRQSAFSALATAARDRELVAQVLPAMLDMLSRENHTMPREGMVQKLNTLLRNQGPASPAAQQILAAHMKAAEERTILPGIRSGEGEYDVGQSIDVLVRESPGQVLALAKTMQKRFGDLSTAYLVKLANDLRGAASKVPGDQRAELEKLLYDDYRPALVARMKTDAGSLPLIDAILALIALKDPDAGWHELGKARHADRLWRFTSIEPTGEDVLHHREKKRFRNITLPAKLAGWFEPGFDDSGWKEGKAPIGAGLFGNQKVSFTNASPWGDDEFLLMRSTFELDATDLDYVRISVLANQGFDIYLNGTKIHTYIWWAAPEYRKIMLDNNQKALLRKGTNHLAVLAGSDYMKDVHVGQIDVYLEGLREEELLDTGKRAVQAADKPLKVFILAGQSNMEGHAEVRTFDYIGKDPLTAPMLREMRNPDGTPRVCDKVWMSYLTGPYDGSANGEGLGKLTAGFGARGDQPTKDGGKIGPEFTFGIYMEKGLDQPILIIKTAWGGRSLNTEFRPPSAGPYPFSEMQLEGMKSRGVDIEKMKAEKAKASGAFYRMMIEHVKKVLADPKRVCPEYDEKQGYEIAGFVWFQGFNDLVDNATYPDRESPDRYALYSDLLATFIRDVRKDLHAPSMPFVIGVLGVSGEKANASIVAFRKAMAAPAALPEFKGNVVAVETAPFWDDEMEAAEPRRAEHERIVGTAHSLKKDGSVDTEWKWENYWKPVGKPLPEERNWRFITVDATETKDKLEQYTGRRFRDITLPAGLENWYLPDFDDSQWTEGKAPIGKGVWKYNGITLDKYPSTWGEGEFLLMRTTFDVDELNFKEYRIAILARQGYNVYLNGNKIHTYIWWQDNPCYGSIVLSQEQMKLLKKGKNVLAAYANDQYGPNDPEHYAALDVRIEGITQADREKLDRALEEVFSLKDRECLKGASNAGYHYMGSAKILGQIGKAFAEAMMTMQKK